MYDNFAEAFDGVTVCVMSRADVRRFPGPTRLLEATGSARLSVQRCTGGPWPGVAAVTVFRRGARVGGRGGVGALSAPERDRVCGRAARIAARAVAYDGGDGGARTENGDRARCRRSWSW